MNLLFDAVFLCAGMVFVAIFAVVGYGFFQHARLFHRIIDRANRELDNIDQVDVMTRHEEAPPRVCGHCGSSLAGDSECPNCGASV